LPVLNSGDGPRSTVILARAQTGGGYRRPGDPQHRRAVLHAQRQDSHGPQSAATPAGQCRVLMSV